MRLLLNLLNLIWLTKLRTEHSPKVNWEKVCRSTFTATEINKMQTSVLLYYIRRTGRVVEWLVHRNSQSYDWGFEPHWCHTVILFGKIWTQLMPPTILSFKWLAMCSSRSGPQGMYITFASAMQTRQNPLWLCRPRGDITRIRKQGYQWVQNRTCECVRPKKLEKIYYIRMHLYQFISFEYWFAPNGLRYVLKNWTYNKKSRTYGTSDLSK